MSLNYGVLNVRKAAALFYVLVFNLAPEPACAEKTAVIPCTKTSDGTIVHEEADVQDRARQFAISDPRFYRIDQFRSAKGLNESGAVMGTCIIDFMSEAEFHIPK
jgi:hypothetical protein